eukprot:7226379-Pyramimonas_sp.AAC.1
MTIPPILKKKTGPPHPSSQSTSEKVRGSVLHVPPPPLGDVHDFSPGREPSKKQLTATQAYLEAWVACRGTLT